MKKYLKTLIYIACLTFACSAVFAQENLSGQSCIDLVSRPSGSTRDQLFDKNGNPKEEFLGMRGQAFFAEKYHQSRMMETFFKISAVMEKREINQLGWKLFHGSVEKYYATKGWIMDENGNLRAEFFGMEGYIAFSEKHYQSNMLKAFFNVSAVLSKTNMDRLGWQQFQGTVDDFHTTKNWIMDENGNLREEFLGMEGYIAFAKEYHESKMYKAFLNNSAILGRSKMKQLGWQVFHGTVSEYRATKNTLVDENGNLREEFLGMEGYVVFSKEYHQSKMYQAFRNTSAVLSKKEMDELGWQQFQGTAHEYHLTRNWIMDENENLREEFLGMDGYAAFAEKYHQGRMGKAFNNTSAVLDKREMDKLGWKIFNGFVDEYRLTRSWIMDENGNLRGEFFGMEGYASFAEKYHESRMTKAFRNTSIVLGKKEMAKLGWQKFNGTVDEYRLARGWIIDENGNLREEFLGMRGQAAFAKEYYESRMEPAFGNTSAVLSEREMTGLDWKKFFGTVDEYHLTRGWIMDENGNLREEFIGMDGLAAFAEKYHESRMKRALGNISAVLSIREMNGLDWQQFVGTVDEYRLTRDRIIDENGDLREEFLGMEGYVAFAEKYHESKMKLAFINISAVLSQKEMDKLGWQQFSGTIEKYYATRNWIMDENGKIREEFIGMEGYAAFAEEYYESRMQPAFSNTSAVLSKSEMDELGWQFFHGLVNEYRSIRIWIMDESRNLREEFLGMEGYAAFAGKYHQGRMGQAFLNTSAALNKEDMDKLSWKLFRGSVDEYRLTRERIMDANGNPQEEFLGMDGYAAFSEQYYDGRMSQAFANTSAVVSKREMGWLGWQQFQGMVDEYHTTKNRIMDENGNLRAEFFGMEGYATFAEQYHQGKMFPAFINISAVLDKKQMKQLGWQQFQGTATEYRVTKNWILDESGNLREEFVGMGGLADFADKYHKSKMWSAFVKTSAVLGGIKEMRRLGFGWKQFRGNSSQYHELIDFFRITDRNLLRGLEGQRLTAETIFEGHTFNTYVNVSILSEKLLGDREEFNHLGWIKGKF